MLLQAMHRKVKYKNRTQFQPWIRANRPFQEPGPGLKFTLISLSLHTNTYQHSNPSSIYAGCLSDELSLAVVLSRVTCSSVVEHLD